MLIANVINTIQKTNFKNNYSKKRQYLNDNTGKFNIHATFNYNQFIISIILLNSILINIL